MTTPKRTRHEQNMEQITGNILTMMRHGTCWNLQTPHEVNESTGWGFDVRYDSNDYTDDRSYTRVDGCKLSHRDLIACYEDARSQANRLLNLWPIPAPLNPWGTPDGKPPWEQETPPE